MQLWKAGAVIASSMVVGVSSLFLNAGVAAAATFTVEDGAAVDDESPGDGVCRSRLRPGTLQRRCTLMAAVEEANNLPGFHTIILPAGTYRFDRLDVFENALTPGQQDVAMVITGQMTVVGAGAGVTEIKSAGLFATGIRVEPGGRLRLHNVTYRDSDSLANAGTELLISNSVIRDNDAFFGGVSVATPGAGSTTTIRNSRITNNRTKIFQAGGRAGGISVIEGDLLVEGSTIDGNEGRCELCAGGVAIQNAAPIFVNTTISGNTAPPTGVGGIFLFNRIAKFRNVTIVGNSSPAVAVVNPPEVSRYMWDNTLVGQNGAVPCSPLTSGRLALPSGDGLDNRNSLETSLQCGFAALPGGISNGGTAVVLTGPLQDNGGPTPTHALLPGNQAIDAGLCPPRTFNRLTPHVDQRGVARPQDGDNNGSDLCDIGAFERPKVTPFIPGGLGVPILAPGSGTARVNETFTETFAWDVPSNLTWNSLGTLDFRLRSNGALVFWVRWDQYLDTFQLVDSSGQTSGFVLPPGLDVPLSANGITLDVAAARSQGSGPAGQRATVVLPLKLNESNSGRVFSIEVSAQDDFKQQDSFSTVGTITVQGAAISDNDKREREEQKPLTELGRLKKARSNHGGFDDEQTEGNVMATRCDQNEIDIAGMDGIMVLKLRGNSRGVCQYVKVGDYVQVDGEKENEQLFWVDDLDVDK